MYLLHRTRNCCFTWVIAVDGCQDGRVSLQQGGQSVQRHVVERRLRSSLSDDDIERYERVREIAEESDDVSNVCCDMTLTLRVQFTRHFQLKQRHTGFS